MNDVLQLKGSFQKRKNGGRRGAVSLNKNVEVTSEELNKLAAQLESIKKEWEKDSFIGGALVSVHHKRILPKSSRLQKLLSDKGKTPNESIRGARFEKEEEEGKVRFKHVFTYFVSLESLGKSINLLEKSALVIERQYNGKISSIDTEKINTGDYDESIMKKSPFLMTVVDAGFVERFDIDKNTEEVKEEESIVTIYKTGIRIDDLLKEAEIDKKNVVELNETTMRMNRLDLIRLKDRMPYLVAMNVNNLGDYSPDYEEDEDYEESRISIQEPKDEPVVGVIDTQFYEDVYFGNWVKYIPKVDKGIPLDKKDFIHGTAISSIIVDGPSFNPELEDGCGRFQVRHFGVAKAGAFSSIAIIKEIEEIVDHNQDIKVWNLSLGSILEVHDNFISIEAAELDRIQYKYDVIFVIAGTNDKDKTLNKRLGAPADSLNSIVVNSVGFDEKPASYSRKGPVLSFFYKPDVCYYGGDGERGIRVCEPLGENQRTGTSFAAPWITRKVAYLIYKMNLSREIAKALIIDSAAGWDRKDFKDYHMGYGIVPKRIEDVLKTQDDEIKFTLSGVIDEYEMYTYNVPVPIVDDKQPFYAKATMVYFPKSNRDQGVDYTNTELDIHFGRTKEKDNRIIIDSINNNKQADEGVYKIYEENARRLYRKWDNVKHLCETIKKRKVPKKTYGPGLWGISIKTKERLEGKPGRGIRFGVVVTLKEMNGVNRINDFINKCVFRGWIVNPINVESQLDVYAKAEEDIEFE